MPKFIVRQSCEYSLVIEANDEEAAFEDSQFVPIENWEREMSEIEVEPLDDDAIG